MKELTLTIKNCADCPYCQYNGDYGRSYDSGYDCQHPQRNGFTRIVDAWDVNNSHNRTPRGWPSIPEKCPLPDKE